MAATIRVEVVSAQEQLLSSSGIMIVVPGVDGELGILAGHTPLITRIKPGSIRIIREGQEEVVIYVSGGMVEVQPDQVTVLADTALYGHDIDEAKALEAKRAVEEALANKESKIDYAMAQVELARAIAQLATIRRLREKH